MGRERAGMQNLNSFLKEQRVLFITTKNIAYIRNSQEIRLIRYHAESINIIYSEKQQYVFRIIEVWIKILKYDVKNIDIILIGFAPQLVLPFFYWKIRNKKIIIDFFISLYDTLINDRKKFCDKGIISSICHWIDSDTLKKADYVIADTKADAKYFIREFKSDADKFMTMYLEADSSIYYPRQQHKRLNLTDKYVVLYFGSILPLQGVDVILEVIRQFKGEKSIFFQMIGPIPKKYNKPIQENVEYIEWLNQKELAEYIANADLCLAGHFNEKIDKAKRTIPGKAYIYNAMCKPMVLGDNEANRELFSDSSIIYFSKMGNPECLKKIIIESRKK